MLRISLPPCKRWKTRGQSFDIAIYNSMMFGKHDESIHIDTYDDSDDHIYMDTYDDNDDYIYINTYHDDIYI